MLTSTINPYATTASNAPSPSSSTHTDPAHTRFSPNPEALHILAHAQTQVREHLDPQARPSHPSQTQHAHSHARHHAHAAQAYQHGSASTPRPRSAHAFATPSVALDPRGPATNPASMCCATDGAGDDANDEDSVVQSIELDAVPSGTAHTLEPVTTDTPNGRYADAVDADDETKRWDEARICNGSVTRKENRVRAGLKRGREGSGRLGVVKKWRGVG